MSASDQILILGVETAARGGSVCIMQDHKVLALTTGDPNISHSNTLLIDVQKCLDLAGVALADIDLFAAASGPGSFTGLRIGIATIKSLATTLHKPCVGVPTLHALAHAGGESKATVALLPAGRGELFVQMLSVSADGLVSELDEAAHLLPQRAMDRYASIANLRWVGSGAQLFRGLISENAAARGIQFGEGIEVAAHGNSIWNLKAEPQNPAANVAALALRQFQDGAKGDPQSLTAIYVRPSDAELKCR
ncbi:MAG: tRNA (adenosine(37)-N6)-threonylcarbamoyltransferase complex dimerization subunit type 1 TsaB [bacterium]